eukprot:TRINITY_DN173_c0_g1_i9.p1 TRINITY_DN173_c0_g1~~TRINITY_DN173_c0_g1_i9.p1  ORF type:complete len:1118 (+),score=414.33 TRINITY_DN173_c0_g1_i9:57-3410(+)
MPVSVAQRVGLVVITCVTLYQTSLPVPPKVPEVHKLPVMTPDLMSRMAVRGVIVHTAIHSSGEGDQVPAFWVRSAHAVGITKYLIATTVWSYRPVALKLPDDALDKLYMADLDLSEVDEHSRAQRFRHLEMLKLLNAGYDVLSMDPEVMFYANPLGEIAAYPHTDLLTMFGGGRPTKGGVTGPLEEPHIALLGAELDVSFALFRSTNVTRSMLQLWGESLLARKEAPGLLLSWLLRDGKLVPNEPGSKTGHALYHIDVVPRGDEQNVYMVYNKTLRLGVLSVLRYRNGVAMQSKVWETYPPVHPVVASPSFHNNKVLGLREAMLVHDDSEYYAAKGEKFLLVDMARIADGLMDRHGRPVRDLRETQSQWWQSVVSRQLRQFRKAVEMAVALNRTLILPKFVLPAVTAGHLKANRAYNGDGREEETMLFSADCDWLIDVEALKRIVPVKESSFLENPRTPDAVKDTVFNVSSLSKTLSSANARVMHVQNIAAVWNGFDDDAAGVSFRSRMTKVLRPVSQDRARWMDHHDYSMYPHVDNTLPVVDRTIRKHPRRYIDDEDYLRSRTRNSTVFMGYTNGCCGDLTAFRYFLESVEKVKLDNFIYAVYPPAYDDMAEKMDGLAREAQYLPNAWVAEVTVPDSINAWEYQLRLRMREVLKIMRHGIDVVQMDTDMVILRNPLELVMQFPEADMLGTTDGFFPTALGEDGMLEDPGIAFKSDVNIGFVLIRGRKAAIDFLHDFLLTLDQILGWDQRRFTQIVRDGKWYPNRPDFSTEKFPLPPDNWKLKDGVRKGLPDGLARVYGGKLVAGIFSVRVITNGMFTSSNLNYPFAKKRVPYVYHVNGVRSKTLAFNEMQLVQEKPAYYDAPEGYLTMDLSIPCLGVGEGSTANYRALHKLLPHDLPFYTHDAVGSFFSALIATQLRQIRDAIALAIAMKRILVLPPLFTLGTGLDMVTTFLKSHPGTPQQSAYTPWTPSSITLLKDGLALDKLQNLQVREYSFLDNPLTPASVKKSVEVIREKMTDKTAATFAATKKDVRVLHVPNIDDVWLGYPDNVAENVDRLREFDRYVHDGVWGWFKPAWGRYPEGSSRKTKRWSMWPDEETGGDIANMQNLLDELKKMAN